MSHKFTKLVKMSIAAGGLMSSLALAQSNTSQWRIWKTGWSEADLKEYSQFVQSIGETRCNSINKCLKGPGNPFRKSDPPNANFRSDCADLPYTLTAYFAWKKGLPFAHASSMNSRGSGGDIRYSRNGNAVGARIDFTSAFLAGKSGVSVINGIVDRVSTAMFRTGPDLDVTRLSTGQVVAPDYYPVAIQRDAIQPGTAFYDPSGHVAVVYKVGEDGRVYLMDAHPDQSITYIQFGEKFGNSRASHGAGFKNFRPLRLEGATKASDGSFQGGRIVPMSNKELKHFSEEQYQNSNWRTKAWSVNGSTTDFYTFSRIRLAKGNLKFEPIEEMRAMMAGLCSDFRDRVASVDAALAKNFDQKTNPDRLPLNIYGTDGDWEEYSTPSRDARLKTAAVELRTTMEKLVTMVRQNDPKVIYKGNNLKADLLAAYQAEASQCQLAYTNSRGDQVPLPYEQLIHRMFKMSFDPYHCAELRWGADLNDTEFQSCRDGNYDIEWYKAEQGLRNQIDRIYDARMDFTLADLRNKVKGTGPLTAPDVDLLSYLRAL